MDIVAADEPMVEDTRAAKDPRPPLDELVAMAAQGDKARVAMWIKPETLKPEPRSPRFNVPWAFGYALDQAAWSGIA